MKQICQHCGKNPANFFYKSTINGQSNEVELCSACARELGYTEAMERSSLNHHFFDLLRPDLDFGIPWLFGSMERPLAVLPVGEPAKREAAGQESALQEKAPDNKWAAQRELNALKAALKQAVETENFEKAIQLRDEIRQKEGQ